MAGGGSDLHDLLDLFGSYGHVDDLVAFMLVASSIPSARGESFNVTTSAVSTRRYIATLAEIVGVEPNIVEVPDDVLKSVTMPVFSHLFGTRHHAELSTAKADAVLPLIDSVWRATCDFDAESDVAARVAALP